MGQVLHSCATTTRGHPCRGWRGRVAAVPPLQADMASRTGSRRTVFGVAALR